jgi:hypothetical protein
MVQRKGRMLYHPEAVRRLVNSMRADMHAYHFEQLTELKRLRTELTEARAAFDQLRAASLARQKAEADLELLKRDRERYTRLADGACFWLH